MQRIGKNKPKTVEKLKTRRCVVRIKRMKTQPTKMTRKPVVVAKPSQQQQQPVTMKKRPVVGPASAKATVQATTSFKAKERIAKTPVVIKNQKLLQEQKKLATTLVQEELPPTIAAGRSRRAHKPNPKYASEDILTPIIIKPTPQQQKSSAAMSLDDFFNKISSDEDDDIIEIKTPNQPKNRTIAAKKKASDSDFDEELEDSDTSLTQSNLRARSKKRTAPEPMARRSSVALVQKPTTILNKTAPATAKTNTPTQLQQLRRTLNANTISPLAMANRKRKLEESSSSSNATTLPVVANKRLQLLTSTPKPTENNAALTRRQTVNPVRESSVTPQVKKTTIALSIDKKQAIQINKRPATPIEKKPTTTTLEERKQTLTADKKQQPLSIDKKPSSSLTRSSSVLSLKTSQRSPISTVSSTNQANLKRTIGKLSSISTSTPNLAKANIGKTSPLVSAPKKSVSTRSLEGNKSAANKSTDSLKEITEDLSTPIVIDDFEETMPTFTIVNINDIINKKGDVLISESPIKSKEENDESIQSPKSNISKSEQTKTQRSQQQQQQNKSIANRTLAANKTSLDRNKSKSTSEILKTNPKLTTATSTPTLSKKPIEKVESKTLNKIINRNSAAASPTPTSAPPATTRPTTRSGGIASNKKPAPRILNSTVGRKTQPVKPVIANLDISSDDPSCSLSLYSDEDDDDIEDEEEDDDESEDYNPNNSKLSASASDLSDSEIVDFIKSKNKPKPKQTTKKPTAATAALLKSATTTTVGKSKANIPITSAKENSASANNLLPKKPTTLQSKLQNRKLSPEKVVVEREGNKIIKKITCFETWYVINIPPDGPEELERNSLELPLIQLANAAKSLKLPSEKWTTKVTLFELNKSSAKGELTLYTGDLSEQNLKETDRDKYQPSCVMFRRQVSDRKLQLPYDRAVIFKNKTFFTNIEGKNIKLVGAPKTITDITEVETLLQIVDDLTLKSNFVEPAAMMI